MLEYDLIAIGSGSSMNIVGPMMQRDPKIRVAVIDKDDPGGICLTRGCIPTKILMYPAEVLRTLDDAKELGLNVTVHHPDFGRIMERMRGMIGEDIEGIRRGLTHAPNIDYYDKPTGFTGPYQLSVAGETITAPMIFLCLGSEVNIPPIKGLAEAGYLSSDSVLQLKKLPDSIAIVGGGYIAAEYGTFFAAMGSKVTIVGRNPQFLPGEEPEVSAVALKQMSRHMSILTDHEVVEVKKHLLGKKELVTRDRATSRTVSVHADAIMIASGRRPNTDILHPERAGIETTEDGWIKVDGYLRTSQPNIWAFGDATGRHLFKHVANYESMVVFYNAVLKKEMKADHHAVPHAVFSHPEVAGVGMREKEAVARLGGERVLVGTQRYEDTAKGMAMNSRDHFVKVIVDGETEAILGAHIVGPHASILIQEIINLMYTRSRSWRPIRRGMHIHPSLSEVVERAFGGLSPVTPPPHHHHHAHSHHDEGHEGH